MYFKLFNFIFYIAVAVLGYLNIYFKEVGLSTNQIGIVNSIAKGVAFLILPLWGVVSDYYRMNKRLLIIAVGGTIFFTFSFLFSESFLMIILVMTFFTLFWTPIIPLFESQLMAYLGRKGSEYGKYRIWGSLGYTLTVPIIGYFLEYTDSSNQFYLMALIFLCSFFLIKRLPNSDAKLKNVSNLGQFKLLLEHKELMLFIIYSFFINLTFNINMIYFPIYLIDIGGGEGLLGLALMISAASEMIIFYYSQEIMKSFKIKYIFLISSLAFALRWFILASFTVPGIILASQLLHSLTFGLFHVSAINYVNVISGEEFKATGRNLYTTAKGVSGILGSLLGGKVYQSVGGSSLYLYLALIALFSGIVYFMILKEKREIGYIGSDLT